MAAQIRVGVMPCMRHALIGRNEWPGVHLAEPVPFADDIDHIGKDRRHGDTRADGDNLHSFRQLFGSDFVLFAELMKGS